MTASSSVNTAVTNSTATSTCKGPKGRPIKLVSSIEASRMCGTRSGNEFEGLALDFLLPVYGRLKGKNLYWKREVEELAPVLKKLRREKLPLTRGNATRMKNNTQEK